MLLELIRKLGWRRMVLIPLALAACMCLFILLLGLPMSLEFSSGTLISYQGLENRPDAASIERSLQGMLQKEVKAEVTTDPVTGKFGLDIQTTALLYENGEKENQVLALLSGFGLENPSILPYEPALGRIYKRQAVEGILIASLAIGLCLLFVYRRKVTLLTVPCVLLDLVAAVGGMCLTRTPLSLASLAGLLLLLGYGVDTNVLLTTYVLKRFEGEPEERVASSMKTGFTITITTLLTMLAVNLFVTNSSLDQLSTVLVFGLAADLLNTWFLNAGILLRHASKRRIYHVSL
jgi:preprotein translocase subunit SecF